MGSAERHAHQLQASTRRPHQLTLLGAVLRFLAPLTPAVLPVVVFIWYRTRRELREIRQELVTLRQAPCRWILGSTISARRSKRSASR